MDFNNALIIFGTAFRKDEKLSENKEKMYFPNLLALLSLVPKLEVM